MAAKTLYDVLGITPSATPEDIKRAFRQQIARYHPDKVEHLGPELREVAAVRAAEITDAYRQLSDLARRSAAAAADAASPSGAADVGEAPAPTDGRPATAAADAGAGPRDVFERDRRGRDDFVRKAALDRLRAATVAVVEGAERVAAAGFDLAYLTRGRRGLLRRDPPLMICGRFAGKVDPDAVRQAWDHAVRLGHASRDLCVFLVGDRVSPRRELSGVIAELRTRLSRVSETRIIVIPVDVNDWGGPIPSDAPAAARQILEGLRTRAH